MAIPVEKFQRVERRQKEAEAIRRPRVSYWKDAWIRLKKNRLAMGGLVVILLLVVMAVAGPYMLPYEYYEIDLKEGKNLEPSGNHWFGTDDLGRDMFVRTWYGARISLTIGIVAALIDLLVGVLYGGISGYKGGRTDEIMMRIVDVLWGLPYLLVVILLLVVMGPGLLTIIIALTVTGWLNMARLVRGQILQLKEQEFVLASKALGASTKRLMLKHLIPNTMGPILVMLTFTVPNAIFAEAFLSFLGLGVQAPIASWGTMINDALVVVLSDEWWRLFFPALFLSLTLLAFNAFGDGLRDALDPKMRK
ncbi:ABC transporter permease [Kroppenstedtia eburnea]|uniref:Dipeptide transport system permease protein n=1 Tax=Kroppenstedtia eburnea TaxID=714067 RepID=A0A1N7M042_9BACL|nr:ABC transporter permease [Kroppenstedtia eburnea]QKI81750.1 ABC transporter permease [Kroppenstedtia eburnea]SIS79432.1 dipeptide transport system permease protein [Kroppenstedtia eburnea]